MDEANTQGNKRRPKGPLPHRKRHNIQHCASCSNTVSHRSTDRRSSRRLASRVSTPSHLLERGMVGARRYTPKVHRYGGSQSDPKHTDNDRRRSIRSQVVLGKVCVPHTHAGRAYTCRDPRRQRCEQRCYCERTQDSTAQPPPLRHRHI